MRLSSKTREALIILKLLLPVCAAYEGFPLLGPKFYLPPEPPSFGLPEVLDARVAVPSSGFSPPALGLETPFANRDAYRIFQLANGAEDQRAQIATQSGSFGNGPSNHVTINEMSCRNSGDELYFRASLLPMKHYEQPLIENAGSGSCKLLKFKSEYRLEFGKDEFWNCGVIDCSSDSGKFYCLSLRFPTISGLRLKDDFKVTLQCRAQEKIASHTRRINLKTIDTAARMAPRVAVGGHKNAFETEAGLYRKGLGSEHAFDAKIESGGTVVLGEDLLLRAAVREGDGWKYSKMSEVTVHFIEKQQRKKVMNSLWILDGEGCLNPQIRDICPQEQYRVGHLESYLLFRAFMFENMRETDEMVLSMKVTGCLSGEDCVVNCPGGHVRKVRDVRAQSRNGTFDWQNDITFKVVASLDDIRQTNKLQIALPVVLSLLALAIAVIAIYVVQLFTRKRRFS